MSEVAVDDPPVGGRILQVQALGLAAIRVHLLRGVGRSRPGGGAAKKHVRIYPLAWPHGWDKARFVNVSGRPLNNIHANDIDLFRELDDVIQEKPAAAFSPKLLGPFAAIGIQKGRLFDPDDGPLARNGTCLSTRATCYQSGWGRYV